MNDKKEMIERLKTNWLPHCKLSSEEKEMIAKYANDALCLQDLPDGEILWCTFGNRDFDRACPIYRLRPDFELEKESLCKSCSNLADDGICYVLSNRACCACRPSHREKCTDFEPRKAEGRWETIYNFGDGYRLQEYVK